MNNKYEHEEKQIKIIFKKAFDILCKNPENKLVIKDVFLSILEYQKHEEFDDFIFPKDYFSYEVNSFGRYVKYTNNGSDSFFRFYFLIIHKENLDSLRVNFRIYVKEHDTDKDLVILDRIEFES